jgi:hypothetical protein
VLLLAWTATKHAFWARNENLLLLSPISLALVILIPAALLAGRGIRRARLLGVIVAALGIAALVRTLMPGAQPNREIVALLLPAHLGIAFALLRPLERRARPVPKSAG